MLILFFRKSFHARIVTMFIVVLLISLCAAYMFTYVFYPEHHRSEQSLSTVEDASMPCFFLKKQRRSPI